MPKVLNARHGGKHPHKDAVYIGRPSPWGNPFVVGQDGTRDEVIIKYIDHLHANPDLVDRVRAHLAGKDLVCWCAPAACHGDILLAVAAGEPVPERTEPAQRTLEL